MPRFTGQIVQIVQIYPHASFCQIVQIYQIYLQIYRASFFQIVQIVQIYLQIYRAADCRLSRLSRLSRFTSSLTGSLTLTLTCSLFVQIVQIVLSCRAAKMLD